MTKFERDFEQVFVEAAMAEDREFGSPREDFEEVMATMECSFVDVTFAEEGEFTESACLPRGSALPQAADQAAA